QGSDGQDIQQAGVDIGQHDFRAEGNHRPGRQRGHQGDDRRENIQDLVGLAGHDDFLGEKFEHVRKRLQQAAVADPGGPEANVHGADHLAFPVSQVGYAQDDGDGDDYDLDERPYDQP